MTMLAAGSMISVLPGQPQHISSPIVLSTDENYILTSDIIAEGSAFIVPQSTTGVVIDLNGFTLTYNNVAQGVPTPGIDLLGYFTGDTRVTNGRIVQGAGGDNNSHAIQVTGTSVGKKTLDYLQIYTHGVDCAGVYTLNNGPNTVDSHHVFSVQTGGCTPVDGNTGAAIQFTSTSSPNTIHDWICLGMHRGPQAQFWGDGDVTPAASSIYNNLVQQTRSKPTSKAPYGILLGRCFNTEVYNNQIVTEDGRGINIDGYSQAAEVRTGNCHVHDNLIDVDYTTSGGQSDGITGIRMRYSASDNLVEDNRIVIRNTLSDNNYAYAFYIGSDSADAFFTNNAFNNNEVILRKGATTAWWQNSVVRFDFGDVVTVSNLDYRTDQVDNGIGSGYDVYHWDDVNHIDNLTLTNNAVIAANAATPTAPTNLRLRKFFDHYVLQWDATVDTAFVIEYRVYRDGVQIPTSDRGGLFYIDEDVSGSHSYTVSSISIDGNEGAQSASISTASAAQGWN